MRLKILQHNNLAKRLTALLLALAVLAALCSCSSGADEPAVQQTQPDFPSDPQQEIIDYPLTLDSLIAQLNAERSVSSGDAGYDPEAFLPDYTSEDFLADEFSDAEFKLLTTRPTVSPESVPIEAAAQDVEYLFRIFRTSYGAYTFFGGDEVFNAVKADILATLQAYSPEIPLSEFRDLLLDNLSFIEDSHFMIGYEDVDFNEKLYFRDKNFLEFRRDSIGYYAYPRNEAEGNRRWYLSPDLEQYMKITIAPSGELVYGIFALCTDREHYSLPDYIVLTNTDGKKAGYTIEWECLLPDSFDSGDSVYSLGIENGVPVVSLHSFYLDKNSFDGINSYLNDAKALRDEPYLILDFSDNTGGYDTISTMWLYSLTEGQRVGLGTGYVSYISRLNDYVLTNKEEEILDLFDKLDFYADFPEYDEESGEDDEELEPGDTYIVEPELDYIEQNRTIFAVFNKYTYSAGELALFQLENMSNVVLVGANSNGCLLTGGTNIDAPVWLPNSGLPLSYSIMLVTDDIMQGFDSAGFQPDIVTDPETAARDIVRCLDYYGKR